MEATVASFRARLALPWLVGEDVADTLASFDAIVAELCVDASPVIVVERDDRAFLLRALAALALGRTCLLATESWPAAMLENLYHAYNTDGEWNDLPPGTLLIATGGSGGRLRFAVHDWSNIVAAVEGYRTFWGYERIDVVNVLPLHHVGGFVPTMRSFITGGHLVLADWKALESAELPALRSSSSHISLVPTQLARLLKSESACEWLHGFGAVLVGGGATSPCLLKEASEKGVQAIPAYGMTEALGTVALAKAEDCKSSVGKVLPHWRVRIDDGEIQIAGGALFKGYWPGEKRTAEWHATGDLGELDSTGRLIVLGRKDRLIITGGEKVNPALVEEALRSSGLCRDAAVFGLDDPEWGQRIVAVIEGVLAEECKLSETLRLTLPAYAIPKAYRFVEKLPRNALGKLDHPALEHLAQ